MQTVFEKLQIENEKNILIQGLPSAVEKQFVKLSYSKNVTPLVKIKKIDFALIFVISQNQMCNILKEVFPALHDNSKVWIAYPKTTSKIASDLNRDCNWMILSDNGYECITQLALDHVWTAMRFKKSESISLKTKAFAEVKHAESHSIDFENRLIDTPAELEPFFVKQKKAKEFFSSLSSTNQKEYVSWIKDAKKAETKQKRVEAVQEKLLAGKRNPSEK